MTEKRSKYQRYDVQIRIVLNPLNWKFECQKYWRGLRVVSVGPVSVSLFYGE